MLKLKERRNGKIDKQKFSELIGKLDQIYFFSSGFKGSQVNQITSEYSKLIVTIMQDTIELTFPNQKNEYSELTNLTNSVEQMINAKQYINKNNHSEC